MSIAVIQSLKVPKVYLLKKLGPLTSNPEGAYGRLPVLFLRMVRGEGPIEYRKFNQHFWQAVYPVGLEKC